MPSFIIVQQKHPNRMPLRAHPRSPVGMDLVWMAVLQVDIPDEWRDWLPAGSPWRDYWTAELE